MKTRTLLLLALGCGLTIMLAGAVFLIQLTTQDDLDPATAVGEAVRVGDMDVTVDDAVESDGLLRVNVTIGGTDDADPADEFRLIASARQVTLAESTCPSVDATATACQIAFDVSGADGVSRVLFYDRGDQSARWVLG